MPKRSLLLVVLVGLPLAACFNDAVPVGARISCTSNDDCPDDMLCRTLIGRCVRADSLDQTPPALEGTSVVVPAVARAGATVAVDFTVDEALAEDPVVRIGARELSLDEGESDRAARAYRFTYAVAGNEPEDSAVPVTVDLADTAGNLATGLAAGTAFFDFTPPALVSSGGVMPAVAAAGTEARLVFAFTEPLSTEPAVTMAREVDEQASRAWAPDGQDASGNLLFGYLVSGDEAPGDWFVSAVATDVAGNVSAPLALGAARLDFAPPQIVATVVSPATLLARPGQVVQVSVTLDEPSASAPSLLAADGERALDFELIGQSGPLQFFQHVVRPGEDGSYLLTLDGVADAAGNALAPQDLATVTLDGTAPGLTGFVPNKRLLNGGDTLTVEFSATEPLSAPPVVTLGELPLAREGSGESPYRYSLPLSGTGLLGSYGVQVELADLAGNLTTLEPEAVQVDAPRS